MQFTAWPEMFSYPYFRNNGLLVYKDMIHPYPPLLTMALSTLYKAFGYNLLVLKIFTWVLILFNDLTIFILVKKVTKKYLYPLIALLFYVLTQPFLEGEAAIFSPIVLTINCQNSIAVWRGFGEVCNIVHKSVSRAKLRKPSFTM